MQVQYVTVFDVESRLPALNLGGVDPAQACLELLGRWIGGRTDEPVPSAALLEDGSCELSEAFGKVRRYAEWEHVSGDGSWATRVERRDVDTDDSTFITRVTVGELLGTTKVRVSLAQELAALALSPAPEVGLYQPALVSMLAQDARLTVLVNGQIQDGRYLQVRSPEETALLAEALNSRQRLPILLLHTRTLTAQAAASLAASRLVGLVRVVTLDYRASRRLYERLPVIDVPYAGGLLVWPDISAPPAVISSNDLSHPDPEILRAALMDRVAALSVLARGADTIYRQARLERQADAARHTAQRSIEAQLSGDLNERVAALQAERDQARTEAAMAVEEWVEADQRAKILADEVALLSAQVEQLSLAARWEGRADEQMSPTITLENAPLRLSVGDVKDLGELCEHLEKAVGGRIAFTPNATVAWRRADRYATPELMRDSLVKLAALARDLYDGTTRSIGHFQTWAREEYGLRISLQDDAMPKKFRTFASQGKTYERVPHVKVNDGVPPQECGRIYFALDPENSQLIVDHVGLHW